MKKNSIEQTKGVGELSLWENVPEEWPGLAAKALKRLAPDDCDTLMSMLDLT